VRAIDCLKDADATSEKMREAIDLLIEVSMKEEAVARAQKSCRFGVRRLKRTTRP
jgi:hypothetical protein